MSIRGKVLLFAVVALALVGMMGAELRQGSSRGYQFRTRVVAIYEQLSIFERMRESAWAYLEELRRAREAGWDTRKSLQEYEHRIDRDLEALKEHLAQEAQVDAQGRAPEDEQRLVALQQARRRWAAQSEEAVRSAQSEAALEHEMKGALLAAFESEVGPRIVEAEQVAYQKLAAMRPLWDWNIARGQTLGYGIPALSLVLIGVLALLILLPLHRLLRVMKAGAERLGHGDFSVALPATRRDELGLLGRTFNRMASELQQTLKEKQQLMQAEAKAAEREFLRYNAMLEETVRTRTVELEKANSQLADSLQQLQATQVQLMFADRLVSMGRVAAGVAHEINNPLAFVLSNLTYLHEQLIRTDAAPSEEERREMLSAVADAYEGADRVRLLVKDLKIFSRQDDADREPVDLSMVVRSAVKMASHELRRRARVVEDCGEVPSVQGNAARLGQVFLNLLLNAAHAIQEGRVEENEIRVAARVVKERVCVEVSDTGCGIPPENLERIFDPFFTTKPAGQGTGLGLSVSHSIVTSLGGTISVESTVGRGTTFRVMLPAMGGMELGESAAATLR